MRINKEIGSDTCVRDHWRNNNEYFLITWREAYKSKQRELVKWVLTRGITNNDLEATDLDEDGVVRAAEFIVYN